MSGERVRLLVRWQYLAGPYWPFVASVPFLRDCPIPETTLPRAPLLSAAADAIEALQPGAVFLDVPLREAVAAALPLHEAGYYVVPVIQRWMDAQAEEGSLEVLGLLSALANQLRRRPRDDDAPRKVAFLLDGERLERSPHASPSTLDNRYQYSHSPFPKPAYYREQRLEPVLWISHQHPLGDVMEYVSELRTAGVPVELLTGCHVVSLAS